MTSRERLLAPFRGTRPDMPAWAADLTYWYGPAESAGRVPAEFRGKDGFRRLHESLGICSYYQCSGRTFRTRHDGVESGKRDEPGEQVRWWRTPRGELSERWRYLARSHCWARTEYAVKTVRDLGVVQDIFLRARHEPDDAAFAAASEFLGDSGLPISSVPRSPLPALLADWCGVERTAYLVTDEPDAVRDTLAIIDRANDAAFQFAAASAVELFHFCDNLDSAASASFFHGYMEEYYRRRLGQLHQVGKVAVVHLDGRLRGLLPKLAACGFDGIESVTPAPVGDVPVSELRQVTGNEKTVLWGGLPGAMFAAPWTARHLDEQTHAVLDALWGDGRLVVGSADQIPPGADIQWCRVVADTIASYCRGRSGLATP